MPSSSFSSLINTLTQQEWSLGLRAASLFVLVVLFQVVMARGVHYLQKETKRRLQHALTGHALVQISYVLPRSVATVLLLVAAAGMFLLQHYLPDQFRQAFGPLLRPNELSGQTLPGAFYFLLGTAMTILLVDDWTIVRYAVECLALADPVASWIGSSIQSPKLNQGSSVSGCLACFATAWMVGWLMLEDAKPFTLTVGAVVCTVAEALPYGNDNLTIPIATSMAVHHLAR
jgi:dolichol kinase